MLEWLHHTDIDNKLNVQQNYYSARLFEYMWHLIFTSKNCESILTYQDMFN